MTNKSTNVRQLMNLLSEKYFGNQLNYTSPKPNTPNHKSHTKTQETPFNLLSPAASSKTSPMFSRLSSSQGKPVETKTKPNQNFNYFQSTKTYLDQTKQKFKKPNQNILKSNDRKKLQLKDTTNASSYAFAYASGNSSSSQLEQNQSAISKSSYSKKWSENDLIRNNSGSYLSPVTFTNLHSCESTKNQTSKLVKESITETKGPSRKLFLKENSSSIQKLESNSTISNSRDSVYTRKQSAQNQNATKKRVQDEERQRIQDRLREQVEFYRSKCIKLEQENNELRDKVSTYQEQFAQEKELVENLKNMMLKREQEIDEIIEKRLMGHEKKEQMLESLRGHNETLRNELEQVREVLKQQESVIMDLYAQNKQKSLHKLQETKEERSTSITKSGGLNKNVSYSIKENSNKYEDQQEKYRSSNSTKMSYSKCPQNSVSGGNSRSNPYRNTHKDIRGSIAQTSYEEDELKDYI